MHIITWYNKLSTLNLNVLMYMNIITIFIIIIIGEY
jgi:hypothetical protein